MTGAALVDRVPGEALVDALRAAMSPEPVRSKTDQLFGRHPVPPHARSWYSGLMGERAVAQQLGRLPPGWLVLHSVPVGSKGSDIDHVLVTPTGRIVTINTKHSPGGKVWLSPKAIFVNGQRQPYLRNSIHEAERAGKLVTAVTGGPVDAVAVIVIVGATLTSRGQPEHVHVVTLHQLVPFLTRRLAPARSTVPAEAVRLAVSQPETWTPTTINHTQTDNVLWFEGLRDRIESARRRRRNWTLAGIAALIGGSSALASTAVTGLSLVT